MTRPERCGHADGRTDGWVWLPGTSIESIGLQENLQETLVFLPKTIAFLQVFPQTKSWIHPFHTGPPCESFRIAAAAFSVSIPVHEEVPCEVLL